MTGIGTWPSCNHICGPANSSTDHCQNLIRRNRGGARLCAVLVPMQQCQDFHLEFPSAEAPRVPNCHGLPAHIDADVFPDWLAACASGAPLAMTTDFCQKLTFSVFTGILRRKLPKLCTAQNNSCAWAVIKACRCSLSQARPARLKSPRRSWTTERAGQGCGHCTSADSSEMSCRPTAVSGDLGHLRGSNRSCRL